MRWKPWWPVVVAVLVVAAFLYVSVERSQVVETLAAHEQRMRHWQRDHPLQTALGATGLYALVVGLSLPAATLLTLLSGWYFGFTAGLAIASIGSTAGATIAFLISRHLLRSWVQQRFGPRITRIDAELAKNGIYYLFTLRLAPLVPFFVVNAAIGLTRVGILPFAWITLVGMLPSTAAYVYAGSTLPSLLELADGGVGQVIHPKLLIALAIVGILPLALRKLTEVLKQRSWNTS